MKTLVKVGIAVGVVGAVVWSIPPARQFVVRKKDEFLGYFHEAENTITTQLLSDKVMDQTEPYDGL